MEKLKSVIEIIAIILAVGYGILRFMKAFRPVQLNKDNLNIEKVNSKRWDNVEKACRIIGIVLIVLYLFLGMEG